MNDKIAVDITTMCQMLGERDVRIRQLLDENAALKARVEQLLDDRGRKPTAVAPAAP